MRLHRLSSPGPTTAGLDLPATPPHSLGPVRAAAARGPGHRVSSTGCAGSAGSASSTAINRIVKLLNQRSARDSNAGLGLGLEPGTDGGGTRRLSWER